MDKNERDIIVNSSNIREFEAMLNEFKESMQQMNDKYTKIAECNIINYIIPIIDFTKNFINRPSIEEYENSQREKSVGSLRDRKNKKKANSNCNSHPEKEKEKEKENTQKSLIALGFVQMKEGDNSSMSVSNKTEKNAGNTNTNSNKTIEENKANSKQLSEGNDNSNIAEAAVVKKNKRQSKDTGNSAKETEAILNKKKEENLLFGITNKQDSKSEGDNNDNDAKDNIDQNQKFNQEFFNYKAFNQPISNPASTKRKHSIASEENKKGKKVNKNWITKETSNNKDNKIIEMKEEEDMNTTNGKMPNSRDDGFSDEEKSLANTNKQSSHLSELKLLLDTNMHINNSNHVSNSNLSVHSYTGVNNEKELESISKNGLNNNANNNNNSNNGTNSVKKPNLINIPSNSNTPSRSRKEYRDSNTINDINTIAGDTSKSKAKIQILNNLNSQSKSLSSQASLEFNSRVQSKDKNYNFNNNIVMPQAQPQLKEEEKKFTKFNEYLKLKKNNQKIQQRESLIDKINNSMSALDKPIDKVNSNAKDTTNANAFAIPDNKIYNLELKTYEDTAYDEFYKLKHNNKGNYRKSMPQYNKNIKPKNLNLLAGLNIQRNKKEREKMQGFKCDLCQNFYDIFDEKQETSLCNECSRHRAQEKPNSTPKGFYDLSF